MGRDEGKRELRPQDEAGVVGSHSQLGPGDVGSKPLGCELEWGPEGRVLLICY